MIKIDDRQGPRPTRTQQLVTLVLNRDDGELPVGADLHRVGLAAEIDLSDDRFRRQIDDRMQFALRYISRSLGAVASVAAGPPRPQTSAPPR